jgi:hypothetical protein
MADMLTIT